MQTQNTMTTALVSAGFPAMPLNKRVWLWLHDHPGKTCREISAAIGALAGDVSVVLLDLRRREMVVRNKTKRLAANGTRMTIFEYTTCIREYELLPKPIKKKGAGTAPSATASAEIEKSAPDIHFLKKTLEPKPLQERGPADTLKFRRELPYWPQPINIKDLPLSEALRLYGELKAAFGDRA